MTRRLVVLVLMLSALGVVLPSVALGGGCHAGPGAHLTGSTATKVAIAGCLFSDTVTYVDPGETVTWTNKDAVPHMVTGAVDSWGDDQTLYRNDKVSYTFDEEGVYPYFCPFHPSMVGAVVVGDATAMAGGTGAGVEKADLAAATGPVDGTRDEGGRSPALIAALVALVLGAGVLTARRRAVRVERQPA
jgi:plastocyanin